MHANASREQHTSKVSSQSPLSFHRMQSDSALAFHLTHVRVLANLLPRKEKQLKKAAEAEKARQLK